MSACARRFFVTSSLSRSCCGLGRRGGEAPNGSASGSMTTYLRFFYVSRSPNGVHGVSGTTCMYACVACVWRRTSMNFHSGPSIHQRDSFPLLGSHRHLALTRRPGRSVGGVIFFFFAAAVDSPPSSQSPPLPLPLSLPAPSLLSARLCARQQQRLRGTRRPLPGHYDLGPVRPSAFRSSSLVCPPGLRYALRNASHE